MTEDFLHYIWKFKLFDKEKLRTDKGEKVQVLSPGEHNTDAGADFFNARLKIGETLWAGNVEIHVSSSDWKKHGHHKDKAYDNVVLQVVYRNDSPVERTDAKPIPTAQLFFDHRLFENYRQLLESTLWIACENQVAEIDEFVLRFWLEKLLVERLEQKAEAIFATLGKEKNNWEQAFYQHLARNFGFKTNAEPFELLAKSLPLIYLAKHKNSLLQIEALLFGQAGFLEKTPDETDPYFETLQKEYLFLQKKFSIEPIENHLWKFLRLRPSNFPTLRIAQFADLIFRSKSLFSKILETKTIDDLRHFFELRASEYWDTHYTFARQSKKRAKRLGASAFDVIAINTIVPFVFVYGKAKGIEEHKERAFDFLNQIRAENNSIVKKWGELGVKARNAADSQALIQLKKHYCSRNRCLECQIGNRLILKK